MASGYRVPLHRETGRGAWDSMRAFVLGLYLSSTMDGEGDLLSASGIQTLSDAKIAELLGVSLHIEKQHERIHGLTIGQLGGPGYELVQLLKTLLGETGKILVNGGYPNLGSFVAEALKEGARAANEKGDPAIAADVVLERVRCCQFNHRRQSVLCSILIRLNFPNVARARLPWLPGHEHRQQPTCVPNSSSLRTKFSLSPRLTRMYCSPSLHHPL